MDVFLNLWFSVIPFKITKLKVHFNLIHKKPTIFGSVPREPGIYTHHIHVLIYIYIHTCIYLYIYIYIGTFMCMHTHRYN